MRVSIITPTYNRATLLPETIDSILNQGYPDLEYIVIDDGSTDETKSVLDRYAGRIHAYRHDNIGETATVNKGFSLVTGDIVCVVSSDDPLLPGAIQKVVDAFEQNPDALAVYPDWMDIGPNSEFLRAVRLPDYDIHSMLLTRSWGLGPGAFFRRTLIERIGGRNPSRIYCGDMEFWAIAAMLGPLVHIPEMLATHRTHPDSASVSQKSSRFAHEWVDTFRDLLDRSELPASILPFRDWILASVYLDARLFAGQHRNYSWVLRLKGIGIIRFVHIISLMGGMVIKIYLKRLLQFVQRVSFKLGMAFIRWRLGLGWAERIPSYGYTRRFAICTRFTPPLWSGQAVVIGRLLEGLPPESYCMVSLPLYPDTTDSIDFTEPLPGKRYSLPPEKALPILARLPLPGRLRNIWRMTGLLYQIWQRGINITKALRGDPADTLLGCSGDLLDLPATWMASRLLGRRFAIHFFDDYTEQWWADPVLRSFASKLERYMVVRADKLLVTNEFMQKEMLSRHKKQAEIIRNPRPSGELREPSGQFPSNPGEVRLVFTGAVYHLNYDILRAIVEAIASIEGITCRLHIYTAQPRVQLESEGLVGPHVVIHGHVKPEEAAEIQRNADILLIPFSFVNDARGIIRTAGTAKLADYLAAGRPVLALCPDDCFLSWFLRERECGLAISSGEPKDISDAIRSIVSQPELRKRLQHNAYQVAKMEFDPLVARNHMSKTLGLLTLPDYLQTPLPINQTDQLRIVQVSAYDLLGIQVNGFLLHKWLHQHGHDSRMLVNSSLSGDAGVREIGTAFQRMLNPYMTRMEKRLNTTAIMPILSRGLKNDPWVRDADVVHLQLIHAAPFFSLLDLPRLSKDKKVLLSVHDMFFMTGHCVYSLECEKWKTGCGQCPDLSLPFPISKDKTARNWKLKRWLFDRSNVDIVVGSPWQEERVSQSPILSRFRRHMIPYGVDTRVFKPRNKKEARRQLGLPEDADVIAFRSTPFHRNFKGTEYIEEALAKYQPRRPTVLLTFEGVGGLHTLRGKYKFHELGWMMESDKIATALQAADIFLMPSTAEAFGLMAIESMACGTPAIVFDGTALPETIGGADCGVIVPYGDAAALARSIEDCLDNPERLEAYRRNGMRHVASKHGFEDYANRYWELYQKLAKEKRS